jgi:hypothetical protein
MAPAEQLRDRLESDAALLRVGGGGLSDARNSDTQPSVTCEQSEILMRPPMMLLNLSLAFACSSVMYQLRVCASELRLALE